MNMSLDRWVEYLLNNAKTSAHDYQPWPGYFESKAREFRMISDFFKPYNKESVLEIGCGNGFTSGLLSGISEKVIAIDLPRKDSFSHSMGIDTAEKFIREMGIRNVAAISGSAENLPFEDASFDIVFSGYVLQYVPDKHKAITEMRRVLKSDGIIVMILPNFIARLYAPIQQYGYFIYRFVSYSMQRFKNRSCIKGKSTLSPTAGGNKASNSKRIYGMEFQRQIPTTENRLKVIAKRFSCDYILLRPDGAYKNFLEELAAHMPWAWKNLFKANDFKILKTFSTEVIPLMFFDIAGKTASDFVSRHSFGVNRVLGDLPIIRECGYSLGIIARKA